MLKDPDCEYINKRSDKLLKVKKFFLGLMLKDPYCEYINKRSDKLLKVKKFDDAEAEVIAHIKGTV